MRKPLFTSSVVPFPAAPRSFGRRPLNSFAGHVTCLMLFAHDETDNNICVSDDGCAIGAVWIPKAFLVIDRTWGRFLVVTISQALAYRHRLSTPIIDRDRFTPEERDDIDDAIQTAASARRIYSGRHDPLPYPGRNAFA